MMRFISPFNRSTTGLGVPARAASMCQAITSKSAALAASANDGTLPSAFRNSVADAGSNTCHDPSNRTSTSA